MIDYIEPKWKIEDFYNLEYEISPYHNIEEINLYKNSGHYENNLSIFKYHQPNPMPTFVTNYIVPTIENFLDNIAVAFNLFKPAHYLPYHRDTYSRYKEVFNIKDKSIYRIILMLEDWEPGQILTIGKKSYSGWNAGKCFYWKNYTPHSFYNLGLKDRYALQITGTLK